VRALLSPPPSVAETSCRAQALLPEEKNKLDQLIDAGHEGIAPTFSAFEEHRDVHKLLSDLRQLIASASPPVQREAVPSLPSLNLTLLSVLRIRMSKPSSFRS
jgi:hypothetical protein